jgi:hypothetical protein
MAAGLAVLLLATVTAGLWVASGWWRLRWSGDLYILRAARGQLVIYRGETTDIPDVREQPSPRWTAGRLPPLTPASPGTPAQSRFNWWAAPEQAPPGTEHDFKVRDWDMRIAAMSIDAGANLKIKGIVPARNIAVVLWPLPVPLWIIGAWFVYSGWRSRRRMKRNQCPACGYSLGGLASSAPCPECGRKRAAEPVNV